MGLWDLPRKTAWNHFIHVQRTGEEKHAVKSFCESQLQICPSFCLIISGNPVYSLTIHHWSEPTVLFDKAETFNFNAVY